MFTAKNERMGVKRIKKLSDCQWEFSQVIVVFFSSSHLFSSDDTYALSPSRGHFKLIISNYPEELNLFP